MRRVNWPASLTVALTLLLPFVAALASGSRSVAILVPARDELTAAVRAVAAADGDDVAIAAGHVLLARSDRPGFARRLRTAGAWLVLPALGFGCGGSGSFAGLQPISSRARS